MIFTPGDARREINWRGLKSLKKKSTKGVLLVKAVLLLLFVYEQRNNNNNNYKKSKRSLIQLQRATIAAKTNRPSKTIFYFSFLLWDLWVKACFGPFWPQPPPPTSLGSCLSSTQQPDVNRPRIFQCTELYLTDNVMKNGELPFGWRWHLIFSVFMNSPKFDDDISWLASTAILFVYTLKHTLAYCVYISSDTPNPQRGVHTHVNKSKTDVELWKRMGSEYFFFFD